MMTLLVSEKHALRAKTEDFIQAVYSREYAARIEAFPSRLLVMLDSKGEIACAAGIRSSEDGFFSECYLDSAIEDALAASACKPVSRDAVLEVSMLVTRAPSAAVAFISQIVEFGEISGFDWAFFTLTRRLKGLLDRIGLDLKLLGSADKTRVQNAESWGRYYEAHPRVYAVERSRVSTYMANHNLVVVNA